MTKRLLAICAALFVFQAARAQLFVDHFSYANGNLGSSGIGDTAWTGGDSANSSITVNSTAALAYTGLTGSTGSGVIFTGGTFKKKAAPFVSQAGNGAAVYCSFLLRVLTAPGTIKAFVYLQNGNSASSSPPLGIFVDSSSRIGLGKSVSSPAVTAASGLSSATHLIVARYSFLSGNDQVDLWIDPGSLGNNASIPGASLTTGTGSSSDAAGLSYVFLNHAASQTLWIDEVRVGTNWAEVTPASGSAPATNVPYVTQTLAAAGSVVLRGTNGPANSLYTVLSTSNLATAQSDWSAAGTNSFDANGNFGWTNPTGAGATAQFYRVLVGAGAVSGGTAPFITTQPGNLIVTAGQSASFTVAASGVSPLSYQWFFNTNTAIAGETNATLTLNNVQTNDAGGYSVLVTNALGSTNSAVATLTVNASTGGSGNLFPVNGAVGVCVDTPLKVTFTNPPILGTSGQIRIYNAANTATPVDTIDIALSSQSKTIGGSSYHYYPVLISGNTATITPHLSGLSYGQTYYVTVDSTSSGVFLDGGNNPIGGISGTNAWRFTTKASAPASGTTNLIVAADGSGDFCTVQGALDFVPSGNTTPRTIHLQNGVYREIVYNNNRNNLTLIGQDRHQTTITYPNNNNLNASSSTRIMFHTSANDIALKSLTLTNSTPQGGSQAEALRVDGLRFVCWNADLDSLQDTILINSSGDQAYFQDCLVQGNVDYVWGLGTIYFTNCEIRSIARGSSPNGYICQPRNDASHNGIAFVNCRLTGSDSNFHDQYLARNNKNDPTPASQTVFINCSMSDNINPAGWLLDGTSSSASLRFWEYQSTDSTGTNLLDVSQRPAWSRQLTASEAASVRDLSTWFSGWVPVVAP